MSRALLSFGGLDSAASMTDLRRMARLFNRAGFGATRTEIEQWAGHGFEAAVDHLLSFPPAYTRSDNAEVTAVVNAAHATDESFHYQHYLVLSKVQRWWLDRMATTSYPLEEKLTLYWHGHFATAYSKVLLLGLMMGQNKMLRDNAAGDFRSLAKLVTEDAGMLLYLDGASNQRGRPNENYAREFMELFTLGHNEGYTQTDVTEAARALTGYVVKGNNVTFDPRRHDVGTKTILSNTGSWGPLEVTDLVLDHHPGDHVAADFVAQRLASFLHHPNPEPAVVAVMAGQFSKSNYQIKPMVRALLTSPEFNGSPLRTIKSPAELVAGVLRALGLAKAGAQPADTAGFLGSGKNDDFALACDAMGQILFDPPNVAGWRGGASWATTGTTVARYNFAFLASQLVASGTVASVTESTAGNPQGITAAWMDQLGLLELSPATSAAIGNCVSAAESAREPSDSIARSVLTLLIASPDYNLR